MTLPTLYGINQYEGVFNVSASAETAGRHYLNNNGATLYGLDERRGLNLTTPESYVHVEGVAADWDLAGDFSVSFDLRISDNTNYDRGILSVRTASGTGWHLIIPAIGRGVSFVSDTGLTLTVSSGLVDDEWIPVTLTRSGTAILLTVGSNSSNTTSGDTFLSPGELTIGRLHTDGSTGYLESDIRDFTIINAGKTVLNILDHGLTESTRIIDTATPEDGGPVASLRDYSGRYAHPIQADATYQPLYRASYANGLPAIDLDQYFLNIPPFESGTCLFACRWPGDATPVNEVKPIVGQLTGTANEKKNSIGHIFDGDLAYIIGGVITYGYGVGDLGNLAVGAITNKESTGNITHFWQGLRKGDLDSYPPIPFTDPAIGRRGDDQYFESELMEVHLGTPFTPDGLVISKSQELIAKYGI